MFSTLGRREWVAIAALAFALLISATFVRADAHIDPGTRTPVIPAPLTPTAVVEATPAPTATPAPNAVPAPAGSWFVRYITTKPRKVEGDVAYPLLDMNFPNAPFFYMHDDNWQLEASTTVDLPRGQQQLTIEHTAAVRVFVDDVEVATAAGSASARRLTALFEHAGGPARIRIEAVDEKGAFVLRWVK